VTLAVPETDGVKITVQLPVDSIHEGGLNEPVAPVDVKLTVPVGVL
jgi:hypothetical protein